MGNAAKGFQSQNFALIGRASSHTNARIGLEHPLNPLLLDPLGEFLVVVLKFVAASSFAVITYHGKSVAFGEAAIEARAAAILAFFFNFEDFHS
jgi:hypothetical protein